MSIEEPVPIVARLPSVEGEAPRDTWAPGPWDDEADKYEWRHLGFPCLIVRGTAGGLCGYVGVPKHHPWHGLRALSDSPLEAIGVHGGVTYADQCNGFICHAPREGEPDDVWWVGFDCAHYMDVCPAIEATLRLVRATMPEHARPVLGSVVEKMGARLHEATYKTVDYVADEVRNLAKQAHVAVHHRRPGGG